MHQVYVKVVKCRLRKGNFPICLLRGKCTCLFPYAFVRTRVGRRMRRIFQIAQSPTTFFSPPKNMSKLRASPPPPVSETFCPAAAVSQAAVRPKEKKDRVWVWVFFPAKEKEREKALIGGGGGEVSDSTITVNVIPYNFDFPLCRRIPNPKNIFPFFPSSAHAQNFSVISSAKSLA